MAALGCDLTACSPFLDGDYTVVFYNVQNLFDDVDDGSEYPEFDPGLGKWSSELYRRKLEAVDRVLRETRAREADVIALAEVENEGVLRRLNEGWLASARYSWLVMAGAPDAAIGIGLLSRLPLREVRLHKTEQTGSRYILEAELEADREILTLFICHWKSKIPDAESTEPQRIQAARLLQTRMREIKKAFPERPILVVGDFNESIDESTRAAGRYPTAFGPADPAALWLRAPGSAGPGGDVAAGAQPVLFSPWLGYSAFPGSYAYRGVWETFDQILLDRALLDGTGLEFEEFQVIRDGFLLNESGYPRAWKVDGGFSDHLPVLVRLRVR